MGDSNNNNKISKGFILVLVLFLIGICSKDEKKDSSYSPPQKEERVAPLNVPIDKLISHYAANEVAADALYQGKEICISGIIFDFGTMSDGHKYVLLVGSNPNSYPVRCSFLYSSSDRLISYSKGQQMTVTGRCVGMSSLGITIDMDRCQ